MSAEANPNLQLEIGHVFFVDIVGYSKLLFAEISVRLRHDARAVR